MVAVLTHLSTASSIITAHDTLGNPLLRDRPFVIHILITASHRSKLWLSWLAAILQGKWILLLIKVIKGIQIAIFIHDIIVVVNVTIYEIISALQLNWILSLRLVCTAAVEVIHLFGFDYLLQVSLGHDLACIRFEYERRPIFPRVLILISVIVNEVDSLLASVFFPLNLTAILGGD